LNATRFVERYREVGGFEFHNIPRADVITVGELPDVIPAVYHRSSRERRLQAPAVALPFRTLLGLRAEQLTTLSREYLAERFMIDPRSKIIISGVAKDRPLEAWWKYPHREKILQSMKALDIDLITVPNFSLLTDVPRWDNLHAMKRIAITWAEFATAGLPTALHVNARTDRDYERWAEFISAREEVTCLAFEFGTAAGWPGRIEWHIAHLCELARSSARPMSIAVRGGVGQLRALREAFERVIFVDTDSFTRTIRRRKADLTDAGRIRWRSVPTSAGAPLDDLFACNIEAMAAWVRSGGPVERRRQAAPAPGGTKDRDNKTAQGSLL
jgi:hypothetical protein